MDIYVKAKELAKLIEESKELCELKELENKAMEDEKAQELIMDYSDIYNNMAQAVNDGDDDRIDELKKDYDDINSKITEYELTKNLFEAKEKFDKVIGSINDIISHAITGDESCCGGNCECNDSCGDSCNDKNCCGE